MFSVCFCLLFLTVLLGLFLPFINYVLYVPNLILHFIKLFANVIADLNFLNYSLFKFNSWLVILSLIACYFIGFALVNKKVKQIVTMLFVFVIVGTTICINMPKTFVANFGSIADTKFGNFVFLANKNNERILIVNELYNDVDVVNKLHDLKINKVNVLVVNNYSVTDNKLIFSLIENFDVDRIIIENTYSDFAYANFSKITYVKAVKLKTETCGVKIEFKYFNNKNIGLTFRVGDNITLMLNDGILEEEINHLSYENVEYDNIIYNNISYSKVTEITAKNYVNV